MAKIGVVYVPLGYGGGECVCFNVIEALQDDHNVTFITDRQPDITDRNRYYGTAVDPTKITVYQVPSRVHQLLKLFPDRFWRFKQQLFNHHLHRIEDEYDLIFSTIDEFELNNHSIQYIHFPKFLRSAPGAIGEDSLVYAVYDRLCDLLYPVSSNPLTDTTVLTNSHWTKAILQTGYDVDADVVYPPIDTDAFSPVPWEDRESGIVTVGRLSPEKRLLELIDVVESLVARGHDIHYHLVGPSDHSAYAKRVKQRVAELPYVHLEGAVSKQRLGTLLSTHRYGLHGMHNEHFGIVLAEMVAAGMLPASHASGGPQEILAPTPSLLYRDWEDAVDVLDTVLLSAERQDTLRGRLAGSANRFDADQFKGTIRTVTANTVRDIHGSAIA